MAKTRQIVPYAVIQSAVGSRAEAMEYILGHFDNYLNKMATKTNCDRFGNQSTYVDPYVKRRLETKLIMSIQKFNLDVA